MMDEIQSRPNGSTIGNENDATMNITRTNFVGVHLLWESDNLRFEFLLGSSCGNEFLHCGGHYFFERPSILIRDLS
jgi:hypothetical protein